MSGTYAEYYAKRHLKVRSYMSAGMAGFVMIFSMFFAPAFAKQSPSDEIMALFETKTAHTTTKADEPKKAPVAASAQPIAEAPVAIATTNYREKVVNLAERELAKKPREYDRTVLMYTEGMREEWCADFVSYIYRESGQTLVNPGNGSWRVPAVVNLRAYFESQGRWQNAGSYVPRPGDVAIYGGRHTNLVVAVENGRMTTIGGNESNTITRANIPYSYGYDGLTGFGVSLD